MVPNHFSLNIHPTPSLFYILLSFGFPLFVSLFFLIVSFSISNKPHFFPLYPPVFLFTFLFVSILFLIISLSISNLPRLFSLYPHPPFFLDSLCFSFLSIYPNFPVSSLFRSLSAYPLSHFIPFFLFLIFLLSLSLSPNVITMYFLSLLLINFVSKYNKTDVVVVQQNDTVSGRFVKDNIFFFFLV